MNYQIRPLGPWIGLVTRNRQSGATFRAPWSKTLDLIGKETAALGARLVVIQVDVTEGDLRRDGMLRANAKVGFPGVRVSFDSRHGPLTYASDTYTEWRANVRAIALSLQALRAVDRYGVSKSGEQYRGWAAIESGAGPLMSADAASRFVAQQAGGGFDAAGVLADPEIRARAYRAAARRLHPDAGGDPDDFKRLGAARRLLDETGGVS